MQLVSGACEETAGGMSGCSAWESDLYGLPHPHPLPLSFLDDPLCAVLLRHLLRQTVVVHGGGQWKNNSQCRRRICHM